MLFKKDYIIMSDVDEVKSWMLFSLSSLISRWVIKNEEITSDLSNYILHVTLM